MIDNLLDRCPNLTIKHDCCMAEYTTFKVGGKAKCVVEVENVDELKLVLSELKANGMDYLILGNGSNTIFKDEGYDGVVIVFSEADEFGRVELSGTTAIVGAAVLMSSFAKHLANYDLTGFEALSGIPGSIGGAVFMNAGAYGTEIKDVLKSVHAISDDGASEYDIPVEKLELGYRHSALMDNNMIVTSARFELSEGNQAEILQKMKEYADMRNSKQPVQYPSAGSFFKRPEGYFAGKLIEDAGLKGLTVGGAQISTLHAGFMINVGDATADDVIKLMHLVQNTVYDKFGVKLEPEVRII